MGSCAPSPPAAAPPPGPPPSARRRAAARGAAGLHTPPAASQPAAPLLHVSFAPPHAAGAGGKRVPVSVESWLAPDSTLGTQAPVSVPERALSAAAAEPVPPPVFAPFHLRIEVLNKEEALARQVHWLFAGVANAVVSDEYFARRVGERLVEEIPEKVREAVGIDLDLEHLEGQSEGAVIVLRAQIRGYDLVQVGQGGMDLDRKGAREFARTFAAIRPVLESMGMADTAREVEQSLNDTIRQKVIDRVAATLPAELAEEPNCIRVRILVRRSEQYKPPVESFRALEEPFLLHVAVTDRGALLAEHAGGRLARAVGRVLPRRTLDRVIARALRREIPAALFARAGVHADCVRVRRRAWLGQRQGLPEAWQKGALVRVAIRGYDAWPPAKMLAAARGRAFAADFAELWRLLGVLERLGVEGIGEKKAEVCATVGELARDGVQEKLRETLQEELRCTVSGGDPTVTGPPREELHLYHEVVEEVDDAESTPPSSAPQSPAQAVPPAAVWGTT